MKAIQLLIPLSALLLASGMAEAKVFQGTAQVAVPPGQDKGAVEQLALDYAKREALESAAVYVDSVTETHASVVTRDTVSIFVKGLAQLVPGSVKKTYGRSGGTETLSLQASFDVDEKEVEDAISKYQTNKSILTRYQADAERFDSLLLKHEYLLRKEKKTAENAQVAGALSPAEQAELSSLLAAKTGQGIEKAADMGTGFMRAAQYKKALAVSDLLVPAAEAYALHHEIATTEMAKLYAWRAQALYNLARYQEAGEAADKALACDPQNYTALLMKKEEARRTGDTSQEDTYVQRVAGKDPVAGYYEMAYQYLARKDFQKAHQAMDQSIALEEKGNGSNHAARLATGYSGKAWIYEVEKNYSQALEYYGKSIAADGTIGVTYSNRGALYEKMGRFQEALADFTRAIELNSRPGSSQDDTRQTQTEDLAVAYFNRAAIYLHLGQWDNALQDAHKAKDLCPDMIDIYGLEEAVRQARGK